MPHLDYVDPDNAEPAVKELLEADAETYGLPSLFARALARNPGCSRPDSSTSRR